MTDGNAQLIMAQEKIAHLEGLLSRQEDINRDLQEENDQLSDQLTRLSEMGGGE
jgi:hypothetical protein